MRTIQFLGACRNVTGSRFLLTTGKKKGLVDCGLYQERDFLSRNWEPFPTPPEELSFVLLTHAHLDHSGYLPRLVKEGFRGTIYATTPTIDIAKIAFEDAAKIYQEDIKKKELRHTKEGRVSKYPYEPLYTASDAQAVIPLFQKVEYDEPVLIDENLSATFHNAGHILGSASIQLTDTLTQKSAVFSGDLGRWNKPLLPDPYSYEKADMLFIESTYGDRNHENYEENDELLAHFITETHKNQGNIIIPSFAIERTQEIIYCLKKLLAQDRIPHLLTFVDSPMAAKVTDIFRKSPEYLREPLARLGSSAFDFPLLHLIQSVEESKGINHLKGSVIIIAGSGMCNGGRVKHHLVTNIERSESTLLFVGYQAHGTLGREIVEGAKKVRIFGSHYHVKARIRSINGFSAHADRDELTQWISSFASPPQKIHLIHGENRALESFKEHLGTLGFSPKIAEYRHTEKFL
ncbi:MAG: MBL fold metallo-hydrolase [Candidatus Ratteibacteria bacterium]|jgi:metallo-beta-lactamase family protein